MNYENSFKKRKFLFFILHNDIYVFLHIFFLVCRMDATQQNIDALNALIDQLEGEDLPALTIIAYTRTSQLDYINQLGQALPDLYALVVDWRGQESASLEHMLKTVLPESEEDENEEDEDETDLPELLHIFGIEGGAVEELLAENEEVVEELGQLFVRAKEYASSIILWLAADFVDFIQKENAGLMDPISQLIQLQDEEAASPKTDSLPTLNSTTSAGTQLQAARDHLDKGEFFGALKPLLEVKQHPEASNPELGEANFHIIRVLHHFGMEAEGFHTEILETIGEEAPYWKARTIRSQAYDAYEAGDQEGFEEHLESAQAIMEAHQLHHLRAETRLQHAAILRQSGDNRNAVLELQAAINDFLQLDDPPPMGSYVRDLAIALERLGKPDLAKEKFGEAAEIFIEEDETEKAAEAYLQQGAIHKNDRMWEEAKASFEKGLPLAKEAGNELQIESIEDFIAEVEKEIKKSKKRRWF